MAIQLFIVNILSLWGKNQIHVFSSNETVISKNGHSFLVLFSFRQNFVGII